ncbi:MAG: T9SS type A sorting domain-containing protein [Bacteroidetes bacterium]|nr:T9SS type A sorting domain-containing protein [Bacteroidota bacterium]
MKNVLLLCLFGFIAAAGYSQSQRFVLFEEFTNASCGPCAAQNPAFDALLTSNATKCTSVKFHTNWPGVDPMNAQNPTDVGKRVAYYSVTGVPWAAMDGAATNGGSYSGAPANVTQTMINTEYAVPSPFELYINQYLSAGQDSIYVTMLGKCTQAVSGTLVAHIAVIEKHIHFTSAPGSNGEKDFYNVLKKLLPTYSGTILPTSFQPGEYFIIQASWKLANVYDKTQLSVVGYIQNNANKNVEQAANTSATPITGVYPNDVELMSMVDALPTYCTNTFTPTIQIRNNGSNPLTSVSFHYKVNSGDLNNFQWTGNLPTLGTVNVQLPTISYGLENSNQLLVYADGTNAAGDDYPRNDTIRYNFNAAIQAGSTVNLSIKTDNSPEETTWIVQDNTGATIASGGPYTQAAHIYNETIPLGFGICYQFTIFDAGGNGVCCGASSGYGYYSLKSGATTIRSGTDFGASESTQFYSPSGVGLPENPNALSFSVTPNPVSSLARVMFENTKPESISISIFNLEGKLVAKRSSNSYEVGSHEEMIDCSKLSPGIYNVQLNTGERIMNQKITISR